MITSVSKVACQETVELGQAVATRGDQELRIFALETGVEGMEFLVLVENVVGLQCLVTGIPGVLGSAWFGLDGYDGVDGLDGGCFLQEVQGGI